LPAGDLGRVRTLPRSPAPTKKPRPSDGRPGHRAVRADQRVPHMKGLRVTRLVHAILECTQGLRGRTVARPGLLRVPADDGADHAAQPVELVLVEVACLDGHAAHAGQLTAQMVHLLAQILSVQPGGLQIVGYAGDAEVAGRVPDDP